MEYMVCTFGYDAPDPIEGIASRKEAAKICDEMTSAWCKKHNVEFTPCEDEYFEYGIDERGIIIFEVVEIPDFRDNVEYFFWMAQRELDKAKYAAKNYAYSLMDNCVDFYVSKARDYLKEMWNCID